MEKRWVLKQQGEMPLVQQLATELNIDPPLANLLLQRGIRRSTERPISRAIGPDARLGLIIT